MGGVCAQIIGPDASGAAVQMEVGLAKPLQWGVVYMLQGLV